MLRLFAAAAAALTLMVLPAVAGTYATLNVLGYSEDGRYFSFEEVGEYDDIEGYFDRIFVVDLKDDSWVKGTPFIVDLDDNGEQNLTYPQVHTQVMDQAAPLLKQLKIGFPANTDMLLPDSLYKDDGKLMVVTHVTCCNSFESDPMLTYKLQLKTYDAKFEEPCRADTAVGFTLTELDGDGTTKVLHDDGPVLPKSRGCPQDYKLYGVFSSVGPLSGPPVAIISYYFYEEEGLSRRFIAVPLWKWTPPSQQG